MEVLSILDAPEPIMCELPEPMAYMECERSCPFCGENMIGIITGQAETDYVCGTCGNEWAVLGVIH